MRVRTAEERAIVAGQILGWKSEQLSRAGDGDPFGHHSELRRLILAAAVQGSLEIYCLRLNGKPIAGVIVLLTKRVFHLWVTAYDPAASSKHSIGLQLIVKTLELAARSGFEFYDFLYGDESYKTDWCNIRATMQHHYVPLSRKGKFICRLLALRLTLKKQLIARPRAMQNIRGARRQFQAMRLFLSKAARRNSASADLQHGSCDLAIVTESPIFCVICAGSARNSQSAGCISSRTRESECSPPVSRVQRHHEIIEEVKRPAP